VVDGPQTEGQRKRFKSHEITVWIEGELYADYVRLEGTINEEGELKIVVVLKDDETGEEFKIHKEPEALVHCKGAYMDLAKLLLSMSRYRKHLDALFAAMGRRKKGKATKWSKKKKTKEKVKITEPKMHNKEYVYSLEEAM
jgi:hypothetical protein